MTVIKRYVFILAVIVGVTGCVANLPPQSEAESLVERARWTVQTFMTREEDNYVVFREQLKSARGIVVIPKLLKGAFVFGGEGGSGVLLARDEAGNWSYPAFYAIGAGSFGPQIGAQSSEVILLLQSDEAVAALIGDQSKFSADVELTFGTFGAGLEGGTTTNFGADVLGFSYSEGLFAGLSIEGMALVRRTDLNEAYYGTSAKPEEIVVYRRFQNAHANNLRQALVF